jgi:hypothetical protein
MRPNWCLTPWIASIRHSRDSVSDTPLRAAQPLVVRVIVQRSPAECALLFRDETRLVRGEGGGNIGPRAVDLRD